MTVDTCPEPDELRRLLQGLLSGPEAGPLEEHLLTCSRCATRASQLPDQDELTAALRARRPLDADEDVLAQVIERGRQLQAQAETIEPQDTQLGESSPAADSATGLPQPREANELLELLSPPEQPDELGRLGGYRVLEVIGVGGMGVVFRAEDPQLQREVALKAMKPAIAASPSAKERFLREARAIAAIEHPHIVPVYQVGEDRNIPFIALQYLRGESLLTRLARTGKLEPREIVRIGRDVASGLAAAHRRGLVHRDIKPDNIWLDEATGWARILDFGLARQHDVDTGLTQVGLVIGTPKYMSPEQAQGETVDHRSDLFSLGSVLYHLASGRPPFAGPNLTATLMAVAAAQPTPIETLVPTLHPELARLIGRLLAKSRTDRPQTADEVARTLSELEPQLTEPEGATLQYQRSPTAVETTPTVVTVAPISEKPGTSGRRHSRTRLVFCLLAVLLLAGLITIVTKQGTVTINIPDNVADDVQVQILTGTDEVAVLDKRNQWTAKLSGGQYTLDLRGGQDEFHLKDNRLTVSRFGKSIVEIDYTPTRSVAKAVPPSDGSSKSGWHGWPADAPPPAIAPFDAEQAKRHQEAWAKYLGVPVEYTNSLGMKFRLIPPGEFLMGSTPEEIEAALKVAGEDQIWRERIQSEAPQHKVILTKPVYVGVTEVTQTQYEQVMGNNPSHFAASGEGKEAVAGLETGNHPVETVSWNDAAEFCIKLSQQEELKPLYSRTGETVAPLEGTGYRLATEAEWEHACRAGTTTRFWSGDHDNDLIAAGWFASNASGRTHAVGELRSNPFGLSDIHGNVWEWVQDCWDPEFYHRFVENPAVGPYNPIHAGSQRVFRGGYWFYHASHCRSSHRFSHDPSHRYQFIGFRVALPVGAVKQAVQQQPEAVTRTAWHGWPADAPPPAIAPFDAEQAKLHQEAWAKYLGVPVEQEVDLGDGVKLTLVLIPPGEFQMGSSPADIERFRPSIKATDNADYLALFEAETPQRHVRITQPFWMGKYEVRFTEFRQFVVQEGFRTAAEVSGEGAIGTIDDRYQRDARLFWNSDFSKRGEADPVTAVSWNDARAFCSWLTRKVPGLKFELPTEAQWEYACRAGTPTPWHSGDDEPALDKSGWTQRNSQVQGLRPVGLLWPNAYSLHDMHGNAYEWCFDWLGTYEDLAENDPVGTPERAYRAFRGGNVGMAAALTRSASRNRNLPETAEMSLGFRVAATPQQP